MVASCHNLSVRSTKGTIRTSPNLIGTYWQGLLLVLKTQTKLFDYALPPDTVGVIEDGLGLSEGKDSAMRAVAARSRSVRRPTERLVLWLGDRGRMRENEIQGLKMAQASSFAFIYFRVAVPACSI